MSITCKLRLRLKMYTAPCRSVLGAPDTKNRSLLSKKRPAATLIPKNLFLLHHLLGLKTNGLTNITIFINGFRCFRKRPYINSLIPINIFTTYFYSKNGAPPSKWTWRSHQGSTIIQERQTGTNLTITKFLMFAKIYTIKTFAFAVSADGLPFNRSTLARLIRIIEL